jgi:DNA polymerase I-like protein with 3'-5' exonuclease and polymerase domains
MGEWIATHHPSGVIQDRTKNLRAWLHDMWKLRRILRGQPPDPSPILVLPESPAEFEHAVEGWSDFAFDLETAKDNHRFVHMLGVSNGHTSVVLDSVMGADIRWARPLFQRPGYRFVQNGMFDMPILRDHGFEWDWDQAFDTMIAGAVLSPDEPNGLAYLVSVYQDYWAWKYRSGGNMAEYNGEDAALTFRLAQEEIKELKEKDQWHYLTRLMPVVWEILIPLHETGAYIDEKKRLQLLEELEERMAQWRSRSDEHFAKLSLQLNQPLSAPLGEQGGLSYTKATALLYDLLKLPKQFDPETGNLAVTHEALKKIRPHDSTGTVNLLLEKSKLGETHGHLTATAPSVDGRIHTRFVLGGDEKHEDLQGAKAARNAPRSGRLSSREPNLQNMHWKSRYVIRATPGLYLVERDYSQIELRLNAKFSGDTGLQQALTAGDAHLYIAWLCDQVHGQFKIGHMPWDEVYGRYRDGDGTVKLARKKQKTPTYGWFYRMGANKLWLAYDVPIKEGKIMLAGLNKAFPRVPEWWEELIADVSKKRFYQNPFGRRRYFFDLKEEVPAICNTPAQSTAADILYDAMLWIARRLKGTVLVDGNLISGREVGRMLLTVHDAIVGEGRDPRLLNRLFKAGMERPFPELDGLVIPSDAKIGTRWGPRYAPDDVPEWGIKNRDEVDPLGMEELHD